MLGGNDDNEEEPINLEFSEQNADPEMMKMIFTLDERMDKNKTRKILLWLTSLKITKASWWEIFLKVAWWLFDKKVSYLVKRKFKKIFLEVISNTKIFNIKFCPIKLPTTKIFTNLHGEGLDNVEYGIQY